METDNSKTTQAVSTPTRSRGATRPKSEWTEATAPKAEITQWKPKRDKSNLYAEADGKIFIFHFEKLYKPEEKMSVYDRFFVDKVSYGSQLPTIATYLNYFIEKYDNDHEVPLALLKLKYAIDKETCGENENGEEIKRFTQDNMPQLISLIYEILFTPTVIEKIKQLVEDNYLDDIEATDNSKYLKDAKKHLESLEFRNIHVKVLLRISFGMKLIAPVMFHFFSVNRMKPERDSDTIYNFYAKLFDIFNEGDMNIYNKLFVYVKAKVLENKSHNSVIFDQRDILGYDEYTVMNSFLRKVLISENIVKYQFNEHYNPKTKKYRENIIGFNKTIIKYQLVYFLKEQYAKNLTEVTSAKNTDGLSGNDKMEMNLSKIDEGRVFLAEMNIATTMARIMKDNDFEISENEIQYYIKNHNMHRLQVQLVCAYWAKYFGGYMNMELINRRQYIILMLILKKRLFDTAGYDGSGSIETCALPYILSGNVSGTVNTRQIRKNKFVEKVRNTALYQKMCEGKYSQLISIKPDYIMEILSKFINTSFTYVVWEEEELLGTPIVYDEDTISDELLFFLSRI